MQFHYVWRKYKFMFCPCISYNSFKDERALVISDTSEMSDQHNVTQILG
jgi:hypothetical protein